MANNLNLFLSLVKSLRYSGSSGAYECRLISLSNSIFAFIILFNSMEVFWLFHKCLRTVTSFYIPFIYFSIINIFFSQYNNKYNNESTWRIRNRHYTNALYGCTVQMHKILSQVRNLKIIWVCLDVDEQHCPENRVQWLSTVRFLSVRPDNDRPFWRQTCPDFHCPCPPTSGLDEHFYYWEYLLIRL